LFVGQLLLLEEIGTYYSSKGMQRFLLFVAITCGVAVGQQPPQGGVITGKVVDSATKEGIRKATVYLHQQDIPRPDNRRGFSPPAVFTIVTDDGGAFRATGLTAASYILRAEKNGYLGPQTGEPAQVAVTPGNEAKAPDLVLTRHSVISGRVMDSDGEPLENVMVTALASRRTRVAAPFSGGAAVVTNDRGEFRIPRLVAGSYKLVAARPRMQFFALGDENMRQQVEAPTYFPSAIDAAAASAVTVGRGEERTGLEIRMQRTPAVRVSGTVTGDLPTNGPVSLSMSSGANTNLNTAADSEGRFQFPSVTPGEYVLSANMHQQGKSLTARRQIRVGGQDVEGLQLELLPYAKVTGRIVAEGGVPLPSERIHVGLESSDPAMPGGLGTAVSPEGAFVLTNAPRQAMRFRQIALPGWYLKKVSVGGQPMPGLEIDLSAGDATVELTYSNKPGRVEGAVEGMEQQVGVMVIAIPDTGGAPAGSRESYRTARLQTGGKTYKIDSIPPGKYVILASFGGLLDAFSDPVAWEKAKPKTVSVEVTEGGTVQASPRLIVETDLDEK